MTAHGDYGLCFLYLGVGCMLNCFSMGLSQALACTWWQRLQVHQAVPAGGALWHHGIQLGNMHPKMFLLVVAARGGVAPGWATCCLQATCPQQQRQSVVSLHRIMALESYRCQFQGTQRLLPVVFF